MLSDGQLVHAATLERYAGDTAAGATYGSPVTVPGYFEGGAQLLESPVTDEAGAVGTFYTNETDLPIGSRLAVQGFAGYVGEAIQLDDGGGMGHTVVAVTAKPRGSEYRTATVSLFKPGTSGWSDADEATTFDAGTPYVTNLAAQIKPLITRTSDRDREVVEETLTRGTYEVTVHHDVEPFEHDEILVDAYPIDASLVGRRLRIVHVSRGSGVIQRLMLCTLVDIPRPS